jgi:hypothetical protein
MSMQNAPAVETRTVAEDITRTLTALVAWLFVAVWLGLQGLGTRGGPPTGLGLAIVVPLALYALDARFGHPILGGLRRLDVPALVALQTFRVLGLVFIVAWAGGALPAGFALLAGTGDVLVGLSAPFVAGAVAARRPHHRRWLRAWNAFGVLDLIVAVSSGVLHSSSSLGFLAGPISTDALARYPLSVVPTFFVPLALLLHFLTARAARSW